MQDVDGEAYLDAFMNGFEFVLLAMRGRLQLTDVPEPERARIQGFVEEYWRIAEAYRARQESPEGAGRMPVLQIEGRVTAALEPTMAN